MYLIIFLIFFVILFLFKIILFKISTLCFEVIFLFRNAFSYFFLEKDHFCCLFMAWFLSWLAFVRNSWEKLSFLARTPAKKLVVLVSLAFQRLIKINHVLIAYLILFLRQNERLFYLRCFCCKLKPHVLIRISIIVAWCRIFFFCSAVLYANVKKMNTNAAIWKNMTTYDATVTKRLRQCMFIKLPNSSTFSGLIWKVVAERQSGRTTMLWLWLRHGFVFIVIIHAHTYISS